jgi:glycosyltransferase involved in cell wall biosynthesis
VGTPVASFKDLFSENLAKEAGSGLLLTDRGEGDPRDFAYFLLEILQREWNRADVAKASEGYSWDDVGKDYLDILSKVAEQAI